MSFLDLLKTRQSDRSFTASPVETEKIDRIIEAARLAPSACNSQPWKFIVVTDSEKRMEIADAVTSKILSMNHFSKQAPIQIVVVEESSNLSSGFGGWAKNKHFPHIDIGIAAVHICLAAADEGLGSCMLGWCNEKKIQNVLNIPKDKRVLLVILIGYTDQKLREKKRKLKDEIVSWDKY